MTRCSDGEERDIKAKSLHQEKYLTEAGCALVVVVELRVRSVDLTYLTFSCGAGPSNRCIPQAGAGPVSCNGLLDGSAWGRATGCAATSDAPTRALESLHITTACWAAVGSTLGICGKSLNRRDGSVHL